MQGNWTTWPLGLPSNLIKVNWARNGPVTHTYRVRKLAFLCWPCKTVTLKVISVSTSSLLSDANWTNSHSKEVWMTCSALIEISTLQQSPSMMRGRYHNWILNEINHQAFFQSKAKYITCHHSPKFLPKTVPLRSPVAAVVQPKAQCLREQHEEPNTSSGRNLHTAEPQLLQLGWAEIPSSVFKLWMAYVTDGNTATVCSCPTGKNFFLELLMEPGSLLITSYVIWHHKTSSALERHMVKSYAHVTYICITHMHPYVF